MALNDKGLPSPLRQESSSFSSLTDTTVLDCTDRAPALSFLGRDFLFPFQDQIPVQLDLFPLVLLIEESTCADFWEASDVAKDLPE